MGNLGYGGVKDAGHAPSVFVAVNRSIQQFSGKLVAAIDRNTAIWPVFKVPHCRAGHYDFGEFQGVCEIGWLAP